jgi:hypothetical protein
VGRHTFHGEADHILQIIAAERQSRRAVPGIEHADRIIVLRQGGIVEEGTHASLLAQGGHYAQLYNTYFRHQSPNYRPGEGFVAVRTTRTLP